MDLYNARHFKRKVCNVVAINKMKKMAKEMLLVELISSSKMNVKLQGDLATVTQMLHTAMEARQDIAAAFMAATIHYAHGRGWDCGELGEKVSIFGFLL